MWKDFKQFVMRGNVLDLAVAVILGVAFGAIVTSVVNDIVMPPIGLALGHVDFKDLFISLNGQSYPTLAAAKAAAAPVIAYGQFLNTVINFLIVAFVIFIVVRQASRFQRKPAAAAPVTRSVRSVAAPFPSWQSAAHSALLNCRPRQARGKRRSDSISADHAISLRPRDFFARLSRKSIRLSTSGLRSWSKWSSGTCRRLSRLANS